MRIASAQLALLLTAAPCISGVVDAQAVPPEAQQIAAAILPLPAALRDGDVSIESLIQQGRSQSGGEVMVAMVTHEGPERCVTKALALLEGSDSLTGEPLVLPILPL